MDPKLKSKIRRLAYRVRESVEKIAEDEVDVRDSFNDPETLGGFCARASAMLSALLAANNIEHQLVYSSSGHVFITCQNYIVDVTATQFRSDVGAVCMRPKESMQSTWWKVSKVFDSISDLIIWQTDNNWPWQQSVQDSDLEYL